MTELKGARKICEFIKRTEATLVDWITRKGFPAVRINGEWVTTVEAAIQWMGKNVKKPKKPLENNKIPRPRW